MVGKRAVKSEVIIEFFAARLPTLQITPLFINYSKWGMVGKRAVKSEVIIEFFAARLPTLQIWGEKNKGKAALFLVSPKCVCDNHKILYDIQSL
jgi:hypothetical protein